MSFAPTIYATSDLHGNLPDVPSDAEVLLLAGDICPDFRSGGYGIGDRPGAEQQSAWLDVRFREWLEYANAQGCQVVGIWGNHDFVGEVPGLVPDLPWELLQDTAVEVRGVTVYGTPWVPGLPRWAFHGTAGFLQRRAEAIPTVDILMSHGPPYGAGDYIPGGEGKQASKYGNIHGIRVGDEALAERLERPGAPKIVICGHIHEDRGMHGSDDSDVFNVAAVDGDYELHENPWTRIYVS